MAQRRMFSKNITESDSFLDMPLSTQALYFHLGMEADDDGFVTPNRVLRMISSTIDDLKLLITKQYVIPFDCGVVVISHWNEHNYIQKDRYKATIYLEEKNKLLNVNNVYELTNNKIENNDYLPKPLWLENRKEKMKESDLPFSFSYKIRNAFIGLPCPVCGNIMEETKDSKNFRPSIQHNKPLMKGGKHEIENISVICYKCNLSLRDTETDELNNSEVIKKWTSIVSGLDTQVRLGKSRVEESRLQKSNSFKTDTLDLLRTKLKESNIIKS